METDLRVCPRCGQMNNDTARSCVSCGRTLSNLDGLLVGLFSPVFHYVAWPAVLVFVLYWVGTKLLAGVTAADPLLVVTGLYALVATLLVIRYFTVYPRLVANALD